jgi:hypothetical protein
VITGQSSAMGHKNGANSVILFLNFAGRTNRGHHLSRKMLRTGPWSILQDDNEFILIFLAWPVRRDNFASEGFQAME